MRFKNPIITGFYPDPSICRVGNDYYIVNSTFEYFPGIPIFHSTDLVNWEQIGHCITRNSQLTYRVDNPNRTGLYAPTIRYSNGVFYVICTNVAYGDIDDGNFFVYTTDVKGEWSDPVWIDCPGIDPSLFFDDDGKVYYSGTHGDIYLCEIDITTGAVISDREAIWGGSGGSYPEGPHLYKTNGYYYLLISEGGTEYGHMITMARSKNIQGPYESCPRNPVLTNRSMGTEIKAVGHADMICDQNNNWWVVCLGIRTLSYPFRHNLGRETMLLPMIWGEDGWPIMGNEGQLEEWIDTDALPLNKNETISLHRDLTYIDTFSNASLNQGWNFIYNPKEDLWSLSEGGLFLRGNGVKLSEAASLAWIGRRQQHHYCQVRTKLSFNCVNDNEEAGMTVYMNNTHHYEIALTSIKGIKHLIVRRQIGSLWRIENQVEYPYNEVELEIEANKEFYLLKYKNGDDFQVLGQGEAHYLSTEVGGFFTGNYFALYASGNGNNCQHPAVFKYFEYEGRENDERAL